MKSIAKSTKVTALKVFSVFMAIVLVVTLSPWGAFGTGDDSDTPADTTVATTPEGEEETTLSTTNSSEDKAAGQSEEQSTGQSASQSTGQSTSQSASQSSNQSSGQSQATGQTTGQTEEQAKVRLNLDLDGGNAYMVYTSDEEGKQTISYPATYVDLPEGKDFTFQAKAANGYVLEAVWFTIGQDEEELTPNADGTYTVSASKLADGRGIEIEVLSAEEAEQLGLLSDEPSVASENGTDITINVALSEASGSAATSEPNLGDGKTLYAYVACEQYKYSGWTGLARITVPLTWSNGSYSATISGLLDSNGKKNNEEYYALNSDTQCTVTLFIASSGIGEGQQWDSNNRTVLETGTLLGSMYTLTLPDSNTVGAGGTYTVTGVGFGAAGSDSLATILTGNTKYFGVITEHFTGNGDAETNFAAKKVSFTSQTGNDLTNPVAQTFIAASVEQDFQIKGERAYVYVPTSDASHITHETASKLTLDRNYSAETLSGWVGEMLQVGSSSSTRLAGVADNAAITYDSSSQKYVLDLTGRSDGTYYVTVDSDLFSKIMDQNSRLQIKKNSGQKIVFNVTARGSLTMWKFDINGVGADSYLLGSEGSSNMAESLVWNFVNASAVTFNGSATGIFLAPNASVSTANTCSGWLIAKEVTINGGEWHNVYQYMVGLGSSTSLQAAKTVDGEKATVNGFQFQLQQKNSSGVWEAIQTVQNTGGTVQFDAITYDGSDFAEGQTEKTYDYKMTEVGSGGATTIGGTSYTTDSTVYYAKVTVTKKTTSENNTTTTVYSAGNPAYYSDEACQQQISDTVPTFANKTNKEDSASVTIAGTKTIEGRNFQSGDSITFTLTDDSSKKVLDTQTITPSEGTSASVSFKELSYTESDLGDATFKDFTYTVTETVAMAGVSTQPEQTVTVTLTRDETGKLVATASQTEENSGVAFAFTNTYSATGSLTLTGTKTLEGQTLDEKNANQFTYSVYDEGNDKVASGTTNAGGAITFDPIAYTLNQTGEHTYIVKENIPEGATETSEGLWKSGCYLYDGTNYTVTVNVTDNGKGELEASVTSVKKGDTAVEGTAVSFANKYEADGSVRLSATKTLSGKSLEAGAFSFELKDANNTVLQTKSNNAEGLVTFDAISYTQAGTYNYTITEKIPEGATTDSNGVTAYQGITYDTKTISVTVEVTDTDNDGVFEAVPTYSVNNTVEGATTFTNTYDASGSITLTGSKKLVADTESSDPVQLKLTETYNFAVYDVDGNVVATGTNDRDGKISFTAIEYDLDDLGDHAYIVKETSANTETVTTDTTEKQITVQVADNGDGTLTAKAVDGNGNEITDVASVLSFSNTHKVADTTATIQVQKKLKDCDWSSIANAGVSNFEFKLTAQNGAPMPTDSETAAAYASATNSTASFASITYTKAGTYNYTITEVVPEGATTVDGVTTYNGITYDTSQTTVTVTVENAVSEDGTTPTLVATVAYGPEGEQTTTVPVITNTYKAAKTTAELTASKTFTLNGADTAVEAGQFEFTLTGENADTPMPFGAEDNVLTAANDENGMVAFGSISYEKAGTYNYTIKEVTPTTDVTANADGTLTDADGITYDTTVHTATVTVEDNGMGQLAATVVYDNDTAASFANSQFKAEANIVADKYLYGSSEGSFQFTLVSADSSYTERTGALAHYDASAQIFDNGQQRFDVTVTNDAFSGGVATVTLPTIAYTEPGTYYYLLGEVAGEDSMAYDASTYQIAVTVAEDGSVSTQYAVVAEGEGAVALGEGEVPAFYNNEVVLTTFRSMSLASLRAVDAGVSVMPEVTKVLTNGTEEVALEAGEFTFTLTGTSENTKGVELTATNDAAGNVAFATTDAITQEQSGALTFTEPGTYTYTIAEVNDGQEMITYDTSAIGLTVTVAADESGALQATTTYYNADGTVTTEPTFNNEQRSVDLRVQKTSKSDGEPLVGARYGLWIYNENGNDVYLGNATSGEDGYMTFTNVDVREGERYYFKEEAAPEGHLVNPYRDPYFYFVYNEETGNYDVYYEGTAEYEEQFPDAL